MSTTNRPYCCTVAGPTCWQHEGCTAFVWLRERDKTFYFDSADMDLGLPGTFIHTPTSPALL